MFYITPVMIMVALATIVYMLSKLFNDKKMSAWARIELYQVFFSIALLIGILILSSAFNDYVVPSLVNTQVPDFTSNNMTSYDISIRYLNIVSNKNLRVMGEILVLKAGIQTASSFVLPVSILKQITFELPLVDISCLDKALSYVFDVLSMFIGSIYAQMFFIKIFQVLMFPIVLPVGIFLRIIPQTRDAGSYLIAIAIGFNIIFPFMYCINYVYMDLVYSGMGQVYDPLGMQNFIENISDTFQNSDVYQWLAGVGIFNPTLFMFTFSTHVLRYLSSLPKDAGFLILNGFILPTLNIILTVSFIRSLQKYMVRRFD